MSSKHAQAAWSGCELGSGGNVQLRVWGSGNSCRSTPLTCSLVKGELTENGAIRTLRIPNSIGVLQVENFSFLKARICSYRGHQEIFTFATHEWDTPKFGSQQGHLSASCIFLKLYIYTHTHTIFSLCWLFSQGILYYTSCSVVGHERDVAVELPFTSIVLGVPRKLTAKLSAWLNTSRTK